MKLIGIGDSVVDYYKHQGVMYPGGNALNVAVFARRNGASGAAYLGIIGEDEPGEHILASLAKEQVDAARVRVVKGITGVATVSVNEEGDRVFLALNKAVRVQSLLKLNLGDADLEYINGFDLIHTSINSDLEPELGKLRHKPISFDFSTANRWNREYLHLVCPHLTYAFFSGSGWTRTEIEDLCGFVHKLGVKVVGVTRGSQAAVFSEQGKWYEQIPVPAKVVDTMGAGDSFIGSFLYHYHESQDMTSAIEKATAFATSVCGYYGAFGHGKEIEL
ncbi:PfkB family carbohydrate kinase [Paenibacillus senegalensis]|uniref:PfkB family carbohydrate kinase n=1 Tax=Paenibacillus senegalensis TaxID=1465766 RepID=UPI00028A0FFC|nr:PfkB family carbohydrate kinase [Paenibacillus senegalensis]